MTLFIVTMEITFDDLRKFACKYSCVELSYLINCHKSNISHFRAGRRGLSGQCLLNLLNLYLSERRCLK